MLIRAAVTRLSCREIGTGLALVLQIQPAEEHAMTRDEITRKILAGKRAIQVRFQLTVPMVIEIHVAESSGVGARECE